MPKKTKDNPSEAPALTNAEVIAAATNSPALSTDTFTLGDREFKLLHLPYKDYVAFVAYLQPIIEAVVRSVRSEDIPGLDIPSDSLNLQNLFKYCREDLPLMALLVCRQSAPAITVAEIEELGKTPFKLAEIVLKQVVFNNIIQDFQSFFVLAAGILSQAALTK